MSHDPTAADEDETLTDMPVPKPRRRAFTASVVDFSPADLAGEDAPAWLKPRSDPGAEEAGAPSVPPPPPPPPPPIGARTVDSWPPPRHPTDSWFPDRPRPPNPIDLTPPEIPEREVREPLPRPSPPPAPLVITDLLWHDRRALPLVRRVPAWRELLLGLDEEPDPVLDDASFSDSPAAMEDRRDVFEVASRADATDVAGARRTLRDAVRDDGKLVPPWVLVEGELRLEVDELATLEAEVALVEPLAAGDETLAAEVKRVRDYLRGSPGSGASPMTAMLSRRLWEAYEGPRRMVQADTLRAQARGIALRRRSYQERDILGGEQLRLTVADGRGDETVVYLPASMARDLPLMSDFRARLVARVHLRIDGDETSPIALQAFAIARRIPSPFATEPSSLPKGG